MMTFFTILLILIGANVIFMAFSLSGSFNGNKKLEKDVTKSTSSKILPLHTEASKYKKAI